MLISSCLLLVSAVAFIWYRFKFLPTHNIKLLLKQGGTRMKPPRDSSDALSGIKSSIKEDPNLKLLVTKIFGRVVIFFVDVDMIKDVLVNHKNYIKANNTSELSLLLHSKGLTKLEGDEWKLHRRIISEAFQYDLFNGMIPKMIDSINDVISLSTKEKRTIKLPQDIELITSDAVTRIFFGLRSKDVVVNGKPASEEATLIIKKNRELTARPMNLIFGKYVMNLFSEYREQKKRIHNFRQVFMKKIQQRIEELSKSSNIETQSTKKTDLLQILLQHRMKHNYDPSQTLSDSDILDEFAVFFLAGKDTTSLLVSMSLYCVVKNPEWGNKLIQEVNNAIKDINDINIDLINSLDIMNAFVSEVLRMYPPAPALLTRIAKEDHYVGNILVKKGQIVNAAFISNNYNPKYFRNASEFDPGRWMKNEDKDEGIRHPFAYLPFSAGQRNCVGKHMALIEAKLIIALILKQFNLEIDEGFKLKMGNQSIGYGPSVPIPLTLIPK